MPVGHYTVPLPGKLWHGPQALDPQLNHHQGLVSDKQVSVALIKLALARRIVSSTSLNPQCGMTNCFKKHPPHHINTVKHRQFPKNPLHCPNRWMYTVRVGRGNVGHETSAHHRVVDWSLSGYLWLCGGFFLEWSKGQTWLINRI